MASIPSEMTEQAGRQPV